MRAAGGAYDPLPLDQAIAFIIEVLPAFQYLHDLGLVYCDFKPDNLIQVGDGIKLIDLGGVRRTRRPRLGDLRHDRLPGAGGAAGRAPSVASDIYTIGRTLAVLAMEFRGYQTTYVASLPPVDQTPLFRQHDSFYRLLLKACAPDPADRFVVRRRAARAAARGAARGRGLGARGRGRALHVIPALRRAHGLRRLARLAGPAARCAPTTATRRCRGCAPSASTTRCSGSRRWRAPRSRQRRGAARPGPRRARGRAARAGRRRGATRCWPTTRGSGARCGCRGWWPSPAGRRAEAQSAFNAVYGQVPGELAPKLALAFACETGGDTDVAESLYVVVRPHRRQLHRAGRVRAGPDPLRPRRRRRRRARARPRAGDQPGVHPGAPAPGRAARRVRRWPAVAGRGARQHRERHDRPRRPVTVPGRGARAPRWAWSSPTAPTPPC